MIDTDNIKPGNVKEIKRRLGFDPDRDSSYACFWDFKINVLRDVYGDSCVKGLLNNGTADGKKELPPRFTDDPDSFWHDDSLRKALPEPLFSRIIAEEGFEDPDVDYSEPDDESFSILDMCKHFSTGFINDLRRKSQEKERDNHDGT